MSKLRVIDRRPLTNIPTELPEWTCGHFGHHSKRSGFLCRKNIVAGRTACRNHGGCVPRGRNSKTFKHGLYSKHLPTRLLARFEAAVTDPTWLSLRKEIALVQMRITELLDSLGSANGTTDKIWREIGTLLDRKQRLADSERRLLYEMKQTITIEQLMLFMSAFAAAVEKHVPDLQVRGAIQIEFDKLARRADPTALDPVQHPR